MFFGVVGDFFFGVVGEYFGVECGVCDCGFDVGVEVDVCVLKIWVFLCDCVFEFC